MLSRVRAAAAFARRLASPPLAGAAAALLTALAAPASATVSTTTVTPTSSAWSSVGVTGPVRIYVTGAGPVWYQVADSQPDAASTGLPLDAGGPAVDIPTTSTVWVMAGPRAHSTVRAVPIAIAGLPYPYKPAGAGQYGLAVATVKSLTPPAGATYAVVCAVGKGVFYTQDGTTTPTASIGDYLAAGVCMPLYGADAIAAFQAIESTSGGYLNATYWR